MHRRRGGIRVCEPIGEPGQWLDPGPVAADDEALRAVVAAARHLPADVLRLHAIPAASPAVAALRLGMPGLSPRPGPPLYRVRLGHEAAVKGRRRRVRRSLVRAERDGTPIATTVHRRPEEVLPLLGEVLEFHAEQWRPDLPNMLVGAPERRAFNEETMRHAAAQGGLVLVTARMGPELVAFEIGFVGGSHGLTYTGTYDRRLRHLSGLGWLVTLALVDAFRDDGNDWLEMGSGSDEFKSEIAESYASWDIVAPLTMRGRVALTAKAMGGAVKGMKDRGRRPGPTRAADEDDDRDP